MMTEKEWLTIPTLPSVSIEKTVAFWELLGYEKTYLQTSPYTYAILQRGGYEMHFADVKGINPHENYAGCLVMVRNAEQVHQEFSQQMKAHLGKVPQSGLPRISRMRPKQTRFTLTDPSGNSIIFINYGKEDDEVAEAYTQEGLTPIQKAVKLAIRLRDYKLDDAAAIKALDSKLKRVKEEAPVDVAQAWVLRLELAEVMHDAEKANECQAEMAKLTLTEAELEQVREALQTALPIEDYFAKE